MVRLPGGTPNGCQRLQGHSLSRRISTVGTSLEMPARLKSLPGCNARIRSYPRLRGGREASPQRRRYGNNRVRKKRAGSRFIGTDRGKPSAGTVFV